MQAAAVFLLANLVAGLTRLATGPAATDRMQALLLCSTSVVAILLLLAYGGAGRALIDVALLFAMLAPWLAIAWTGHRGRREDAS